MGAHKGAYLTDENGNLMDYEVQGYKHLIAKYLVGAKEQGGYFLSSDTTAAIREKIKALFHLDIIYDICPKNEDNTIGNAIGFIGGVRTDFYSTDGVSPAIQSFPSPNCQYHNLNDTTGRKGAMAFQKTEALDYNGTQRTGVSTYRLLNDAGLNTLGDLTSVDIDYFFANALQVKANVKAPFYDNVEANVYALIPTSTGEYKVSDGTKAVVLKRNEGVATASVLLNQSIGYSETETGMSTIVTEINTEEGTMRIEQDLRALPELKVLELVKCESASTNPQTELEKEGVQTIRVAIFNKHYNMFVFPSSEGGVTGSGVLFGSTSVPTKYNFPYFRPVQYNEDGLVALQAANGFVDNQLTDKYPAATADIPDLESGYYADINNTAQGYWISQTNAGYIEKLWTPNWSAIKPVVSIYAFWQLTDSNLGKYSVRIQASVSAVQTSDITITSATIQLKNANGSVLSTFSISGLTIAAGEVISNVIARTNVQAMGLSSVGWGAIAINPANVYQVVGETKNTPIRIA